MTMCRIALALAFCVTSTWSQPHQNNSIYHIFVRSFSDTPSDQGPNGEIGDLRGIREKLDYLNDGRPGKGDDLEVGILWLMPIFRTGTYHGYDIEDYRSVNPDYGTLQDLRDLVQEAHRRGVRVILDVAFNHTSNRHPWFLEAVRDPKSQYRNFYHLQPANGPASSKRWRTLGDVRYFAHFGERMPDLNFEEPAVRAEAKAIAKFWLDQGIDGFRLDAAKYVFDDGDGKLSEDEVRKNNEWWQDFANYVRSVNPQAVLVGEVLGAPEVLRSHVAGFDALLDYPFLKAARDHIAAPRPGFLATWLTLLKSYRAQRSDFQPWIYLGSHDETPRLASFLQNRTPADAEQRYRLGMYMLFTLARHPILYNGDELMQRGVKWPEDGSRVYDETIREPFPWFRSRVSPPQTSWFAPRYDKPNDGISVEEQDRPGTMLDLVRRFARLRVQHPEFANGNIDSILADTAEWLVFTKGNYLALIRTSPEAGAYRPADIPQWRGARVVFSSEGTPKSATAGSVSVPGFGFVLLQRL